METFSGIKLSVDKFADRIEQQVNKVSFSDDFNHLPANLQTKEARLKKALADFWEFDRIYFPKEMYGDGYSEPNRMMKDIVTLSQKPGVHIIFGPRKHGKTITAKKLLLWLHLSGKTDISGFYCETLNKSQNLVDDVSRLLTQNDLLLRDFRIEVITNNKDSLEFYTSSAKGLNTIASFSEGRSVRGFTRNFARPKKIVVDDAETLESPLSHDAVDLRIKKLAETAQSLDEDGTLLVLANDFDERSALHKLRVLFENGLLSAKWYVYIYQAWENGKSMWKRFKAKSESELKKLLGALDESDWQANFQQNPLPPDGIIFPRENLQFVDIMPNDAIGVIYCDPNLALKSKGDTTAIIALYYSRSTAKYYVDDLVCKSFSNPNDLLDSFLKIRGSQIKISGFDGNVSQEATWTNFVKSYCMLKGLPFPYIKYCRYNVDLCAKNASAVWSNGEIFFTKNATMKKDYEKAIQQLFSFSGKKSRKADDFPDALVCAYELMHERGVARANTKGGFYAKFESTF